MIYQVTDYLYIDCLICQVNANPTTLEYDEMISHTTQVPAKTKKKLLLEQTQHALTGHINQLADQYNAPPLIHWLVFA